MSAQEDLKRVVGYKAVDDFVVSNSVVGLGTGSTARYAVLRLAEHLKSGKLENVVGVCTSEATRILAEEEGIVVKTLDDLDGAKISVSIDGADEVAPDLSLTKGGGAAHLREKMVEAASEKFVCIVDGSKLVPGLGATFKIPVEVVPFGIRHISKLLENLPSIAAVNGKAILREKPPVNGKSRTVITDNGNYILDLALESHLVDVRQAAAELSGVVGVVEHGLFIDMCQTVIVATAEGARVAGEGGEAPWW